MIRIARPENCPSNLRRSGEKQTQCDCAAYDSCPRQYHSGAARFPKRMHYSTKVVKDVLVEMHHSKCCYCEKRFRSSAYLHVEHFRPKCGVRQDPDQRTDDLPGYYWLAYNWSNLLLSCLDCNSRYKRTLFPLANPTERARSHHHDIDLERPLFIDPVAEDPRDHIHFIDDAPVGTTPQGRTVIERLGLGRVELREDRLALLAHIKVRRDFVRLAAKRRADAELQAKVMEARKFIEDAVKAESEFSSMAKDYVASHAL